MYPKVAEIKVKTKHLECKIPIRAKKIIIRRMKCDTCRMEEPVRRVILGYRKFRYDDAYRELKFIDRVYDGEDYNLPDGFIKGDKLVCPHCYTQKGDEFFNGLVKRSLAETRYMYPVEIHKIKLYTGENPLFVDMENVIFYAFKSNKWRDDAFQGRRRAGGKRTFSSYIEDLDEMDKVLETFSLKGIKKWPKKATLEVVKNKDFKPEMLDEAYEKYLQRKMVRAL